MPQGRILSFDGPDSVGVLDGWTIREPMLEGNQMKMRVTHPVAEGDVNVYVIPGIRIVVNGEKMLVGVGKSFQGTLGGQVVAIEPMLHVIPKNAE